MKARDLERLLVEASGRSASDIDQRMRFLRRSGLILKGARGTHAPDIAGMAAAVMILAATGSIRAVDAEAAMDRFSFARLYLKGRPDDGEPFDFALARLVMRPDLAAQVKRVRLNLTAGCARIEYLNGTLEHYLPYGADVPPEGPEAYGEEGIYDACVIAGSFLHTVAVATHEATTAYLAQGAPLTAAIAGAPATKIEGAA